MKNFKVGKELTSILLSSTDITNIIDNRVFPLVANAGTSFPFIVYRRSGYKPYSDKDYTDEVARVELAILSDNYIDGVQLADIVSDALEKKQTDTIDNITIDDSSEEYNNDTYIQKINLIITLK